MGEEFVEDWKGDTDFYDPISTPLIEQGNGPLLSSSKPQQQTTQGGVSTYTENLDTPTHQKASLGSFFKSAQDSFSNGKYKVTKTFHQYVWGVKDSLDDCDPCSNGQKKLSPSEVALERRQCFEGVMWFLGYVLLLSFFLFVFACMALSHYAPGVYNRYPIIPRSDTFVESYSPSLKDTGLYASPKEKIIFFRSELPSDTTPIGGNMQISPERSLQYYTNLAHRHRLLNQAFTHNTELKDVEFLQGGEMWQRYSSILDEAERTLAVPYKDLFTALHPEIESNTQTESNSQSQQPPSDISTKDNQQQVIQEKLPNPTEEELAQLFRPSRDSVTDRPFEWNIPFISTIHAVQSSQRRALVFAQHAAREAQVAAFHALEPVKTIIKPQPLAFSTQAFESKNTNDISIDTNDDYNDGNKMSNQWITTNEAQLSSTTNSKFATLFTQQAPYGPFVSLQPVPTFTAYLDPKSRIALPEHLYSEYHPDMLFPSPPILISSGHDEFNFSIQPLPQRRPRGQFSNIPFDPIANYTQDFRYLSTHRLDRKIAKYPQFQKYQAHALSVSLQGVCFSDYFPSSWLTEHGYSRDVGNGTLPGQYVDLSRHPNYLSLRRDWYGFPPETPLDAIPRHPHLPPAPLNVRSFKTGEMMLSNWEHRCVSPTYIHDPSDFSPMDVFHPIPEWRGSSKRYFGHEDLRSFFDQCSRLLVLTSTYNNQAPYVPERVNELVDMRSLGGHHGVQLSDYFDTMPNCEGFYHDYLKRNQTWTTSEVGLKHINNFEKDWLALQHGVGTTFTLHALILLQKALLKPHGNAATNPDQTNTKNAVYDPINNRLIVRKAVYDDFINDLAFTAKIGVPDDDNNNNNNNDQTNNNENINNGNNNNNDQVNNDSELVSHSTNYVEYLKKHEPSKLSRDYRIGGVAGVNVPTKKHYPFIWIPQLHGLRIYYNDARHVESQGLQLLPYNSRYTKIITPQSNPTAKKPTKTKQPKKSATPKRRPTTNKKPTILQDEVIHNLIDLPPIVSNPNQPIVNEMRELTLIEKQRKASRHDRRDDSPEENDPLLFAIVNQNNKTLYTKVHYNAKFQEVLKNGGSLHSTDRFDLPSLMNPALPKTATDASHFGQCYSHWFKKIKWRSHVPRQYSAHLSDIRGTGQPYLMRAPDTGEFVYAMLVNQIGERPLAKSKKRIPWNLHFVLFMDPLSMNVIAFTQIPTRSDLYDHCNYIPQSKSEKSLVCPRLDPELKPTYIHDWFPNTTPLTITFTDAGDIVDEYLQGTKINNPRHVLDGMAYYPMSTQFQISLNVGNDVSFLQEINLENLWFDRMSCDAARFRPNML